LSSIYLLSSTYNAIAELCGKTKLGYLLQDTIITSQHARKFVVVTILVRREVK
jgi:hypothetical protein